MGYCSIIADNKFIVISIDKKNKKLSKYIKEQKNMDL